MPVRLQDRDYRILETLDKCGPVSVNQLSQYIFTGLHVTRVYSTMDRLVEAKYVTVPTKEEYADFGGIWVYWLTEKGFQALAEYRGTEITKADIARGKHRYKSASLKHTLRVNDIYIAVHQAAERAGLTLGTWMSELELRRLPKEQIVYRRMDGTKGVRNSLIPDGFFTVSRILPNKKLQTFAFLLELDRGTETEERIANEKIRPGIAYLSSKTFRESIGLNFGRWLIVTDRGDGRMNNMRKECREAGGAKAFYFSTLDGLKYGARQILTDPVWFLADQDAPLALIPPIA